MSRYSIDATMQNIQRHNRWYHGRPMVDEAVNDGHPDGINIAGYFRDESGWGAAGRGYVRALQSLGMPLALNDLSSLSTNRSCDDTLTAFAGEFPYDLNLVCIDAGQHFALLSRLGPEFFDGRYTIGAWAWELPRFPEGWYDRFAYYDEIWVGTAYIANSLSPIAPVPVVRIPPVLTPTVTGDRLRGRRRLGIGAGEFVFLFVFDFHSHLARKNPLAVIDAFRAAFALTDPARLIVKCVNPDSDPPGFATLQARASGHNIAIHAGYWPRQEVADLMAACDAYVSLHRAEGTGLTISDAMAAGKPTIATGWSGNMDFMDVANSYPVRYRLVTLDESVGPYRSGEQWAEPSTAHAGELMRHVFTHRDEASAIGEQARRTIAERYSEQAVARLIAGRLEVIASRGRFGAFQREMRTYFAEYQRLIRQIGATAATVVPAGASVAVVSKGDDSLLSLRGLHACHFPQTADGTYAGYHPADTAAAISEVAAVRERGADYVLFPGTAYWWFEHYDGLERYLSDMYEAVWRDDACAIYRLLPERSARHAVPEAGEIARCQASGEGRANDGAHHR